MEVLRADHGDDILTKIPQRVAVQDAALAGKSVRAHEPRSEAAEAFAKLAKEVISRVETT